MLLMPKQDVMKRKAMEIDKSKMDRARDGKAPSSTYVPSSMSSISISGARSGADLDVTPTYSRSAPVSCPSLSDKHATMFIPL